MVHFTDFNNLFGKNRTSKIPMSLGIEKTPTVDGKALVRVRHTLCGLPKNHSYHAENSRSQLIMAITFANNNRKSKTCRPIKAEVTQVPCHVTKKMRKAMRAFCCELREEDGSNNIGDALFLDFCLKCRKEEPEDTTAIEQEVSEQSFLIGHSNFFPDNCRPCDYSTV